MKKLRVILVAIVAVALLSPASVLADTWGEPINVPGARFVILGSYQNQGVLDQETGLVWERSPGASTEWWGGSQVACNVKILEIAWAAPAHHSGTGEPHRPHGSVWTQAPIRTSLYHRGCVTVDALLVGHQPRQLDGVGRVLPFPPRRCSPPEWQCACLVRARRQGVNPQ